MLVKDNRGFFMPSKLYIYAIVFLVIAGTIMFFYLSNKALKAKVELLEGRVAILETANTGLQSNLEKERASGRKAIAFYQKKLDECITEKRECELVVIDGCPTVTIVDSGDDTLLLLQTVWGW